MADLVEALRAAGVSDVVTDAPAAPLTTLRVGGPLAALVTVRDGAELEAVGRVVRDLEAATIVVGRGSNLLVADAGFRGVAIRLGPAFRDVTIEGTVVTAGAAAAQPTVARLVAEAGLAGLGWMAAVPGSIGGAVRMNAGAHGGETRQLLRAATIVTLGSGARAWTPDELDFGYRHSAVGEGDVVVHATFALEAGDPDAIRREMEEIRNWRREHQPLNEPNCGSVFTNPPGDSAGRLIDAAGCKGYEVGGATVSTRHANFIVTRPGATARDVAAVIDHVIATVAEVAGVTLQTEVVRVGWETD
ncbi:MAG: UDP-N-acetylmuramate dehydrogenase [Nitriliruptorales bacterium]|nr:UDP-N-acetylmuramate dehydrogenase [Nitriliruptorales bacterium]